ncbi:metallophosphoesterase [Breoghania sp.]|uniref:metallophosphoesterase family protein n=1 Tax=Breoghania sp. TaxID=2065378 RepID=UPI0029C9E6BA|nr:metallophosphoesterase [Breoghania sp.]
MFKLAHLSDPHLGPLPSPTLRELASKRALGYMNWQRNRASKFTTAHLDGLVADIKDQAPDHIALTGDLVNIAIDAELEPARRWLDALGSPQDVSVVPGNHDAYVPGALRKASEIWAPYMRGDGNTGAVSYPYVRRRGDVALIGVSSARASAPFMATGHVSSGQADRLAACLEACGRQGLFRVVMIHHPPVRGATHWHKRLVAGSRVRKAVQASGAELVLHGHTHINSLHWLKGRDGPVPVVCVPAASNAPGGGKPGARFNIFEIERANEGWRCHWRERGYLKPGEGVVEISAQDLTSDLAEAAQ